MTLRALAAALALLPAWAYAGAWTLKDGEAQLLQSLTVYESDRFVDKDGDGTGIPTYRKQEYQAYGEYGLRDATTLGVQLAATRAAQSGFEQSHIGTSRWFVRQRLWQGSEWVLSVEPALQLPAPFKEGDAVPAAGPDVASAQLRALVGYSPSGWWGNPFISAEGGYRKREGNTGDQWLADVTAGVHINEKTMLLAQVFSTISADAIPLQTPALNPDRRFDLATAQVSGVYWLRPDVGVHLGVSHDLVARNTGEGSAVLIGLWKRW